MDDLFLQFQTIIILQSDYLFFSESPHEPVFKAHSTPVDILK